MSAKWNNPAIPAMQEKLHADEREAHCLGKLIAHLYLQEAVCEEKIKLYEQRKDAFKILFWGDLLDQCETVRIRTRQQPEI